MKYPVILGETLLLPVELKCTRFVFGFLCAKGIWNCDDFDEGRKGAGEGVGIFVVHDDMEMYTLSMLKALPLLSGVENCLQSHISQCNEQGISSWAHLKVCPLCHKAYSETSK